MLKNKIEAERNEDGNYNVTFFKDGLIFEILRNQPFDLVLEAIKDFGKTESLSKFELVIK